MFIEGNCMCYNCREREGVNWSHDCCLEEPPYSLHMKEHVVQKRHAL